MDTITLLREFVKAEHDWLEATLGDATSVQCDWTPQGNANSVAANYAHLVTAEDFLINTLANGQPPLMATTMEGKTGISEPPTMGDWAEWARRVQVDLPAVRAYAQTVYANTDAFLSGLTEADLNRSVDLSMFNYGQMPLPLFILGFIGGHVAMHAGEISCIKGLQGLRDYPT